MADVAAGQAALDAVMAEPDAEALRSEAVGYYVDAMMLNDLDNREEAIRKLNHAIELDPHFAMAHSLKGDILQGMEKYEESADAYEEATIIDPWSFNDFFNLGKVTQVIKQFARSVKAYVAACNLEPQHYGAHIGAAQGYYELKEYDDSMAYANKAKELDPEQADPEQLLGDLFEAQKNHPEAINAYRRALELKGNDPEIMVSLARAYLRSGRYSSAKELLTDVVIADDENGMAYQYLGFAQLKLKDTQAAVENYQRAVEIDDNDWMAHKGLGVAYMLMSMKENNVKLQALATEQWGISLQIKSDQPKLQKLMERYN
ncbi:MAG: tetratricopeptide repeat protein [Planctomycetota bacterium]|jgi:tetratricopeptide (TPR) repeat protein